MFFFPAESPLARPYNTFWRLGEPLCWYLSLYDIIHGRVKFQRRLGAVPSLLETPHLEAVVFKRVHLLLVLDDDLADLRTRGADVQGLLATTRLGSA